MTDIAGPASFARTVDFSSEEASARIRRRYRAEARFKLYGLGALGLAALALVLLLTDIVLKAWPAFIEHRVVLTVTATLEQVSTDGKLDRASLVGGDYSAAVRAALQELFPEVSDRGTRRKLFGDILSSGASDALRKRIIDDPSLIGKPVTLPFLLDDTVDLYLKGLIADRGERKGRGAATVSGTAGNVEIRSSADDFATDLADVKKALAAASQKYRREAERLSRFAIAAVVASDRAALQASADENLARANELEARAKAAGAAERLDANAPSKLIAINGGVVKLTSISGAQASGTVLSALSGTGGAAPGGWRVVTIVQPEADRRLGDQQIAWIEKLREKSLVERGFAWRFFTSGDSRESEQAGLLGALVGSALTMLVTLALCLPTGVAAAIYLQEFAPKNRFTDLIEVNVNNLAAVPSIVFGLLGLAVFLSFFGMPRSAPLVGGLVLALLVLPTIIIASRAALSAVPPSIREAALGVGASPQQVVFHHVLPLAMPGIMTGTILGMAHALGETAPLLLIGMVAFIVDVPASITEAATVLPVQIYLWSDLPEAGFQAKTAGAIVVLLLFLFVMNGVAILLRRRFERRW